MCFTCRHRHSVIPVVVLAEYLYLYLLSNLLLCLYADTHLVSIRQLGNENILLCRVRIAVSEACRSCIAGLPTFH